jgi:hypothetical protein
MLKDALENGHHIRILTAYARLEGECVPLPARRQAWVHEAELALQRFDNTWSSRSEMV